MDARPVRIAVAVALVALVAACAQAPQVGTLALTITAPAGVVPSVDVTGPGTTVEVTESGALTNLTPGTYTIDPNTVETANTAHAGVERYGAAPGSVAVAAGQTATATVAYAYVGFTITDPAGDADGTVGPEPIFDAIAFSSQVVADDLVLTIVLRDDQDELGALVGIIDIDTDRDATTGDAPAMNSFCDPVALGTEARVQFEAGTLDALLETPGGDVPVGITATANTVAITIPLATLGSSDGRVHAGLVLGNTDEPTDCVPGGAGSL
jgi:hypothetical protein